MMKSYGGVWERVYGGNLPSSLFVVLGFRSAAHVQVFIFVLGSLTVLLVFFFIYVNR